MCPWEGGEEKVYLGIALGFGFFLGVWNHEGGKRTREREKEGKESVSQYSSTLLVKRFE